MTTVETIRQALTCGQPRCSCGHAKGLVHCPAHEDKTPSLSVSESNGKILVKCHAGCSQEAVIEALRRRGIWPPRNDDWPKVHKDSSLVKPKAVYEYHDAAGQLIFQVCRYQTSSGKTFRQRRPDTKNPGKWIWSTKGVSLLPYRLPQLLQAEIVFVVEGEKDVATLEHLGLVATCNPGGAGKWRPSYNVHFKRKRVIILPDNDEPGRTHAQDVARNLYDLAVSVKVVELPDLPEKGDVSDWTLAGGTAEKLAILVKDAPQWEPPRSMPEIVITRRFLHDKSNEAIKALEAANDRPFLFRRFGNLVRISLDEKAHPHIEIINDIQLRGILARCAYFWKETDKGKVATVPPLDLVKDILGLGEWSFPPLEGIVQAPTLRPDGSVFNDPGYDPITRLFYVKPPNLFVPPIPVNPTEEDVKDAVSLIREIITDFPFEDQADRANCIALIITLPLRPAIPSNVPMAVISAPAPGTGKSLLQDIVAIIGTGESAPMAGFPRDDDEMRKFITSRLLAGDPLVSFDNLELPLWGPSLARALTCQEWEDRVLGGNTTARLPQKAVWVANGNNLKIRGDLPRRTFPIRLDAKLSRPWERQDFKQKNLRDWVSRWRGDFLGAILTVGRAWFIAQKPEPKKPLPVMGGFESWVEIIGGILSSAGVEGFLENLEQFNDEADLEGPEWEAFLEAWANTVGQDSKTCQEVTAILRDNPDFAATLPDNLEHILRDPEKSFERSLGRALARKEKRPYGQNNLSLQRVPTPRKVTLWKVAPF
jgi:hypothetical protein